MNRIMKWLFLFAVCGVAPKAAFAELMTGVTGGGATHGNRQPSLTLNYVVRTEGPARELGQVMLFGGNFAPGGWELADGQLLTVDEHPELFTRVGTTYGGDGVATFALPDLRGRTALGHGTGPGLTPRQLGEMVGVEAVTLTESQLPAHSHMLPSSGMTGSTGGNEPHDNMQPSLALNYLIAAQGFFPSSSGGSGGALIEPFLGQVSLLAGDVVPNGWLPADGQLLPINQNQALFALLGNTYGGDGRTTFALPDLRGRTIIHEGAGPGLTDRPLGQMMGVEAVALTEAQLPAHSHTLPPTSDMTGNAGGNEPHENMQPSLTLNYIIALQGIFPPRDGGGESLTAPYIGQVSLFAGNFAPGGWAFADGQLLPINQNQALFSLLGTTYGGDGQTTFALPDLRGRTALGHGTGAGLTSRQLGEMAGVEAVTLTEAQLPAHSHTVVPEPATALSATLALLFAMRRRLWLAECELRRNSCAKGTETD